MNFVVVTALALLAVSVSSESDIGAGAQSGVNWLPFSVSERAVVSTDFSNLAVEQFYVKLPCEESVWFKLFLYGADALYSGHVQIFSKVKGNIYCNGAGAKNWYTGEKTDFTMEDGAMKCESDNKNIILVVEKTADRVTIKNKGQVLYNQAFSDNDANCRQATTKVTTQVWNYDDSLGLAVFDNSVTPSWREDLRCGPKFPLADGSPSQCNPDHPNGAVCCSKFGWCSDKPKWCTCKTCVDYGRK